METGASVMLCSRDRDWFLSTGINREKGLCWLRCGPKMPHPTSFDPLPPAGALVYGSVPLDESIRFFPEIRHHGIRVVPKGWHRESEEPLVRCHMEPHHLVSDGNTERYMQLVDEMRARGWEWDIREGGDAYIHVDDLEKIEGPPPDGAF